MEANTMRAQRDKYAAEVKSLRCKLQQRIKKKRRRMREQRAEDMHEFNEEDGEEQERVFLRKRPRTESTPKRQSKSPGPSCSHSPGPSCSKSPGPSCSKNSQTQTHMSSSSEPSRDTDDSSTSPPIHSPWFCGRGRGNIMRDITFPRIIEEYLQGYRKHYEGIDPTVRLQENAVSKISRVKSFLVFMAQSACLTGSSERFEEDTLLVPEPDKVEPTGHDL